MGEINILKPEIYNLIAAGEVIETPCGALKELVENSIDSGANRIIIEVQGGGFGLIAVTDNGCGIREEDIENAFIKHGTSKVRYAHDLFAVQTLGFRGEALPSIAAVSRMKVTTRHRSSDVGIRVSVENGVVSDKQYVAANVGSRFEVRDLFYNTPARKKFFKSDKRETAEMTKFVARLIMCNPNLQVTYIADSTTIYSTKGEGLEEALFAVYGNDCLSNCLKISYQREGMRIEGYIGTPEYSKANRNYQTLAVNGRYIIDSNISGAIMQAYKRYLMTRHYPFYVLDLEIPCDRVDVNVHPKKSEVRFADVRGVCSAFYHTVSDALRKYVEASANETFKSHLQEEEIAEASYLEKVNQLLDDGEIEFMTPAQREADEAIENSTVKEDNEVDFELLLQISDRDITVQNARKSLGLESASVQQKKSALDKNQNAEQEQQAKLEDKEENPAENLLETAVDPAEDLFERTRILGAAFRTYLILELDDKLIFVDQHAAHERILFEKFMAHKLQDMQPVMFPYVFTVSADEAEFIDDNIDNIAAAGLEIEPFGENTYRICAVSTLLADTRMEEFVQYLLSSIDEFKLDDKALIVEKIAKKACKAAVKAGYHLSETEIRYILLSVYNGKLLQCPHGRPITIVYTKTQLEKMFKRIV